jgi:hypothetical protein
MSVSLARTAGQVNAYPELEDNELRERLNEWVRFSPENSFDPSYMGRVRRTALRDMRAELLRRGLPTV